MSLEVGFVTNFLNHKNHELKRTAQWLHFHSLSNCSGKFAILGLKSSLLFLQLQETDLVSSK